VDITKEPLTSGFPVGESVLGNLCADAYRNAINAYRGTSNALQNMTGDNNPIQIAFVPNGVVRDPLKAGNITFSDLYNVLPLGADPADTSALGYPLVTAYIKAADIYTIVGLSIAMGMDLDGGFASPNDEFFINIAGIAVKIGGTQNGLNLGFDVYLCPTDNNTSSPNYGINANSPDGTNLGTFINPGDTTLYKAVVDLYTLLMMYQISTVDPSKSVKIYDKDGNELNQSAAAARRVIVSGKNMRAWQSLIGWASGVTSQGTINLSDVGYTSNASKRYQQ